MKINTEKLRAAGVFIVDNSHKKVLLSKRGPTARNEPGKWEGVGGEVEENESFEEGAIREVFEELGVYAINLLVLSEHESVEDAKGLIWHTKRFIANISEEPVIQDEGKIAEFRWFKPDELDDLEVTSYLKSDMPILKQYLSNEHL